MLNNNCIMTTIHHINYDEWTCIFNFLDHTDLMTLLYVNGQLNNIVKTYEPKIISVDYLLGCYVSVTAKTVRRNKNIVAKYDTVYKSVVHKFPDILNVLQWTGNLTFFEKNRDFLLCKKIIRYGHLNYVKSVTYLIQHGIFNADEISELYRAAVLSGSIRKLKILHRTGCYGWECSNVCQIIASTGNSKMLQWARTSKDYLYNHLCSWDADVCAEAAEAGHYDLLEWAIDNGCPRDIHMKINAERYHPHDDRLRHLVNIFSPSDDKTAPVIYAVEKNDCQLLKWCLENNYEWNTQTCTDVIKRGYIDIIIVAHTMGQYIIPNICDIAASHGQLDIVKWAADHSYFLDQNQIIITIARRCIERCQIKLTDDPHKNIYGYSVPIIINIYVEIFEWICKFKMNKVDYDCWIKETFYGTYRHNISIGTDPGTLTSQDIYPFSIPPMMAWYLTHDNDIHLVKWCDFIIGTGNFLLLQWVHKRGYDLPPNLCDIIVSVDRTIVCEMVLRQMLMWAHANGFALSSNICKWAAYHKDYKMLTWAVEVGCEINFEDDIGYDVNDMRHLTYRWALYTKNNVELLKWLTTQGFVWDDYTRDMATRYGLYSEVNRNRCIVM